MADYVSRLVEHLRELSDTSERSMQAEIGWSELGGCRAYLGYRLDDAWGEHDTDSWRADCGSALHEWLAYQRSIMAYHDNQEVQFEVPCEYRGVPGHADEVNWTLREVVDYKFPSLSASSVWRRDADAVTEKMSQLHGYGMALFGGGEFGVTVRLLVCPVDGSYADWWSHAETLDPFTADAHVDQLESVRRMRDAGEPLPRDKPYPWCERFCEYFKQCRGDPPDWEEITDPELATAVEQYGEAKERSSEAERDKKRLAPLIRGLRGSARGWKVLQTRPGEPKEEPDLEQIRLDYQLAGWTLPTRTKPGAEPALRVERDE